MMRTIADSAEVGLSTEGEARDVDSITSTLLSVVLLVGKGLDDSGAVQGLFEHKGGAEGALSVR